MNRHDLSPACDATGLNIPLLDRYFQHELQPVVCRGSSRFHSTHQRFVRDVCTGAR
jgi:hypothetical protein